ncbi:MAG TPA: acetoacetate--CoA ligase [Bacteroidales bacterium]|nr:acetoacetate--CoA ligase [Bacteroidales bacterium]HRX97129.1 acetoacetate--CoA ligase [Bacteroidales bacterium]
MTDTILWRPAENYKTSSAMYRFLSYIADKYHLRDNTYPTVHRWSVENIENFWAEVWDFTKVIASEPYSEILDDPHKMPGAKWFQGAKLNFAENLLRRRDDHTAIIFRGEDSVKREITYAELYEEVKRVAAGLKKLGVKKDDRVSAFMPNMPETVIGMLATTSIGAIWSSTSPDFGTKGVLDRFSQINPKVIFAADGYFYKGKAFDSQEKLKEILTGLPTLEAVVMTDYTGNLDIKAIPKGKSWNDLARPTDQELTFEQLPFDHPLYIMYSSGTTGLPKSIVHSAGGTLIQHLKELILHSNIDETQTVFYFTTCGWMMWNWFVSALATGATLVLYDGNPFYPTPDALLRMADELGISFFGTSAKYIASLESEGVIPKEISDFPKLNVIASTGSPLIDASYRYVYKHWKEDVQLSSIAGGTDIISCFMLGSPTLPVHIGEIQCRGLGMAVECFDDEGQPVIDEQGELVCTRPFPSMPLHFLNDPGNKRYHAAYFEVYPNVWRHGDNIVISGHGGITMYGRSDATLNPQGVRIGTAEIYGVVETMEEIEDSVVVGKKQDGDEIVVLFIILNAGYQLDEALIKKIKTTIRDNCSPRHVPAIIKEVPEIPYTINGKKVEIAVKQIIHGQKVKNRDALANPESLEFYYDVF